MQDALRDALQALAPPLTLSQESAVSGQLTQADVDSDLFRSHKQVKGEVEHMGGAKIVVVRQTDPKDESRHCRSCQRCAVM